MKGNLYTHVFFVYFYYYKEYATGQRKSYIGTQTIFLLFRILTLLNQQKLMRLGKKFWQVFIVTLMQWGGESENHYRFPCLLLKGGQAVPFMG